MINPNDMCLGRSSISVFAVGSKATYKGSSPSPSRMAFDSTTSQPALHTLQRFSWRVGLTVQSELLHCIVLRTSAGTCIKEILGQYWTVGFDGEPVTVLGACMKQH